MGDESVAVSATYKNAALSPQKARLVADEIRGLQVGKALNWLKFTEKKAAKLIQGVLESAIANAEHNDGADIDELKISKVCVDQAPSLKRFKARAKGRANGIVKRRCHILIEVTEL